MVEHTASIPYFAHEGEMWRQERYIKRMQALCGVMAAALALNAVSRLIEVKR